MSDTERFLEKYDKLPEGKRKAIAWVVSNYDLAKKMCENCSFSSEDIQRLKLEAMEREDDLFLTLLLFSEQLKQGEENRESGAPEPEA